MNTIESQLAALIDAEDILNRAQTLLSIGPMFPYVNVKHAKAYINQQIADYFKEEVAA
jgi:hypothetical protein